MGQEKRRLEARRKRGLAATVVVDDGTGRRRETASLQRSRGRYLEPSPRRRDRATSSDQTSTPTVSIDGIERPRDTVLAGEEGSGGRR